MEDYGRLVKQAQSGTAQEQHEAFDELVRRFRAMAHSRAYAILEDAQLAEDATQEAFIAAYLRIDQLRDPQAFPGWLSRIVLTQCDRITRGVRPTIQALDDDFELATESPSPEATVEAWEIEARVHSAIASLPEHERTVTQGFYLRGESQQELADQLQIPVATVKKRLQYARQHLRGLIGDLNAALDQAFADMWTTPKPQRQPIPIYNRRNDPPEE